ncbi:hypothetical protein [Shewanella fidelis]|uniref:Porin n=2 Tax=Shewanella TaxID=22 RepID=A0AAW8NN01_9GAMM|nr:hypothetical protein [Shewanella fidelis]MDR8523189.1 hypothetical protein [Shewanella fidelis]MDW4811485.1 hypothetical protein [Shewanella fidelis]MDW4815606.1 hypothetical protein [Shewanella fidelis]MDW4819696.1 hypothetical protein [Shewanella fidelis]MDW4824330.1 hypothetical protein [Shewanella fidelis]
MKKLKLSILIGALLGAPTVAMADDFQPSVELGGAVKVKYFVDDANQASKSNGGEFAFDALELDIDSQISENWTASAKYIFKNSSSNHFVKYAYAAYNGVEDWQFQGGIVSKPFGNKSFISHNWWESINYYMGFEDDYDLGAKAIYNSGAWTSEIAFFKNSEYAANDTRSYAADTYSGTINGTEYNNEETNTFNIRQSYVLDFDKLTVQLGASLEYGQIYDSLHDDHGTSTAYAVHLDAQYSGYQLQLQMVDYDYDQFDSEGKNGLYAMKMGEGAYEVAAKGQIFAANIAKSIGYDWGTVTVYNDYSHLTPDTDVNPKLNDSVINTTGVSIAVSDFFIYVDHIYGKNAVWIGGQSGLGIENQDDDFHSLFNISVGYYF